MDDYGRGGPRFWGGDSWDPRGDEDDLFDPAYDVDAREALEDFDERERAR